MEPIRDTAKELATQAHTGQLYGSHPYMDHLNKVAEILRLFGYIDTTYRDAALLHDILEDTPTTIHDLIQAKIGDTTLAIISFCTDCTDEPRHNRKTRKTKTFKRNQALISLYLKDNDAYSYVPMAIRVKLADRLANIQSCIKQKNQKLLEMYRKEANPFRTALYHPGIADAMWSEYDKLVSL